MVGRLDKETTGLLLLTSDGRVVNAVCRASGGHEKTYEVQTTRRVSDEALERLRRGVVITTTAQSDGNKRELTARTRPCGVTRVPHPREDNHQRRQQQQQQQHCLRMTLRYGTEALSLEQGKGNTWV